MEIPIISQITLAISAISLLLSLYPFARKLIGRIDVIFYGPAIISLTGFGSTIAFPFTLRSRRFDPFVTNIRADIVQIETGEKRTFEMTLFRHENINAKTDNAGNSIAATETQMELASPFLLFESTPRFMDILFTHLPDRLNFLALREKVQERGNNAGLRKEIRESLFWIEGTYSAEISFLTHKPTKAIKSKVDFSVSSDDVKALLENDEPTIAEWQTGRVSRYALRFPILRIRQ